MRRSLLIILAIAAIIAVCSNSTSAELDIPESGTFDIVIDPCDPCDTPGLNFSFESDPPILPGSPSVFVWPFATDDLYSGPGSDYNLALAQFSNGSPAITDYGEIEGDLGIRIDNHTFQTQTFAASILTLDFVEESLDVYLPEFTFDHGNKIFFWVAQSGATYYANFLKGVGEIDMSATSAMAAGDEYLARIPEPATVGLFGLGAILLRRRRKFLSNRL